MPTTPAVSTLTSAAWFPVLTLLLGFAAKWVTDWAQNRWSREREREARIEARRDKLTERRTDLQRATILELQDAILGLAREMALIHLEDQQAFRKGVAWGRHLGAPEPDEKFRAAQALTSKLNSRLIDNDARALVSEFKELCTTVVNSSDKNLSDLAHARGANMIRAIIEALGALLRNIDGAD